MFSSSQSNDSSYGPAKRPRPHPLTVVWRGPQLRSVASEHRLHVPRVVADELLEGLPGVPTGQPVGQSRPAGQGLDALAIAVGPQPAEAHPGLPSQFGLRDVIGKQGSEVAELD